MSLGPAPQIALRENVAGVDVVVMTSGAVEPFKERKRRVQELIDAPGLTRGILEVMIDESGVVTASVMRRSAHRLYDPLLLDAARRWSYYPAMKGERAVRYRKTIVVTLHPER